jgi:proteasome lid subunit RPN8/RPN11
MWQIKKELLEDIIESSKNYFPKEFMCFLSGDLKKQIIDEFVLLPTENGENFASISLNVIPIDNSILGSIHSHPNGNPYPSQADKKFFKRYQINAIIGLTQDSVKIIFYNKNGEREEVLIK